MWLLSKLPVKVSHDLGFVFLKLYGKVKPSQTLTWRPFTWRGIEFTNPLGISGGMDKNADHISHWWTMGTGFIEVGTVTPRAQEANPGRILDRDRRSQSLWNHMGFPNRGVHYLVKNLRSLYRPHFTPIFVNIGKNRSTPLEDAHKDYIECMKVTSLYADAFVVNISSPNTEGLRDLLKPKLLSHFLTSINEARLKTHTRDLNDVPPLFLKLSPDISQEEFFSVLKISLDTGIDGWVLTNTTSHRQSPCPFPENGGISGNLLADRSKECLKLAVDFLGDKKKEKLLISVGGVMTPQDVLERLNMGADLVQVYSTLVFRGPFFFRAVAEFMELHPL